MNVPLLITDVRDSLDLPAMPPRRVILRANRTTLAGIDDLVRALPITGTLAGVIAPVLGDAAAMLTGGWMLAADDTLPDGTWILDIDGIEQTRGTVELPAQ